MIRQLIQQVLSSGYLSADTEAKLALLFQGSCSVSELDTLMDLQHAVMSGYVKRESSSPHSTPMVREEREVM